MGDIHFEEWVLQVSAAITKDALWKHTVYRLALYLSDMCWKDIVIIEKTAGTRAVADQLYRAVGSIGANIAEGFSRYSSRDRARFYEYALGSARESRDWYFKSRQVLGEDKVDRRYQILTQIIKLMLTMIPNERHIVRDNEISYDISEDQPA